MASYDKVEEQEKRYTIVKMKEVFDEPFYVTTY